DAYVGAKQAHEHVAVDEGAKVAEHRLDLNIWGVGDQAGETLSVGLGRFRDLHEAPLLDVAGARLLRRPGANSLLMISPVSRTMARSPRSSFARSQDRRVTVER